MNDSTGLKHLEIPIGQSELKKLPDEAEIIFNDFITDLLHL